MRSRYFDKKTRFHPVFVKRFINQQRAGPSRSHILSHAPTVSGSRSLTLSRSHALHVSPCSLAKTQNSTLPVAAPLANGYTFTSNALA